MPVDLRPLHSFGDVAAEDDAVLEYFLTTDAVKKVADNDVFLLLGRKGAGKTAIVRHFTESDQSKTSRAINLRGYPWNVHASRIDRGASEIEAYVAAWRYLIAVEFAALGLRACEASRHPKAKVIEEYFKENYGGVDPKLGDVLRPSKLKLSEISLAPSLMGNKLGGVSLDRKQNDISFGRELDAVSTALLDAVKDLAAASGLEGLFLHFDELDQGLSQLDDSRSKMIVGLILAAREVRRDFSRSGLAFNPIVYLRTDLWNELEFSDKNKISQTQTLNLEWDAASLKELVNARLRARLGNAAEWENVIDEGLMRGSQSKWNHIVARSLLRPRDIIQFLNSTLVVAKKRVDTPLVFVNEDLVTARDPYSSYLKSELDDEVLPHWKHWEEALKACSGISTVTFDREQFDDEYRKRQTVENQLNSSEALQVLYRFSIVGYERRSGYGGSSWVFQYTDPAVGWDSGASRFKVHLGLKEYAKLREERR